MKKTVFLLFSTVTLRRLAISLLALFSPLFIFQLLASHGQLVRQPLLGVAFYFLFFYLIKILFFPLAERTAFKFGFKWSIFCSIFPFFFYIVFLILSSRNLVFLIPASFFGGFQAAFFWFGYHGLFVKFGDEKLFGFQAGLSQILGFLSLLLAPLLGSFLVLNWGFDSLFLVAFLLSCISVVIILISPLIKPYHRASLKKCFFLFKTHRRVTSAYLGWGGEATLYAVFWPIFLILIFDDILIFGGIIFGSVLLTSLLVYLIGRMVDKMASGKIIRLGVLLGVFSWLVRIIARLPLLIIVIDGFYRLAEQMFAIPMDVFSYRKAREGGTCQALFFREISLNLGAILFLVLAVLAFWLSLSLWFVFLIALLGTLGPFLIIRKV